MSQPAPSSQGVSAVISSQRGSRVRSITSSDGDGGAKDNVDANSSAKKQPPPTTFSCIEQLACCEHVLWNLLDGLKTHATHVSFFCREYWHSAASLAQLSVDKHFANSVRARDSQAATLHKQVLISSVLESLSLGLLSYYASGTMESVSPHHFKKLAQMIYYVHENVLIILDYICTYWTQNADNRQSSVTNNGSVPARPDPKPKDLNTEILTRINRYRKVRRGDHQMALRQQNEMLINSIKEFTRGYRQTPISDRTSRGTRLTSGTRPLSSARLATDGVARAMREAKNGEKESPGGGRKSSGIYDVLSIVSEIVVSRSPLDKIKPAGLRTRIVNVLKFKAIQQNKANGAPEQAAWDYGDSSDYESSNSKAETIWFEPLPPMLPKLDIASPLNPLGSNVSLLHPVKSPEIYTLVLDLDETLVHYFEVESQGYYEQRPGCQEFLRKMNQLGYEVVVFTAATQDYADWVIDQIDPKPAEDQNSRVQGSLEGRGPSSSSTYPLVHSRLYRQHALPWGPIFVKDLRRLGRDLDRTIIIDNVQENFMLQPDNGIFIAPWYEDPTDSVLKTLTPLLEEMVTTRSTVPDILQRYKDRIHQLAGHEIIDPQTTTASAQQDSWETRDEAMPLEDPDYDGPRRPPPRPTCTSQRIPQGSVAHRIAPQVTQQALSPFSVIPPRQQISQNTQLNQNTLFQQRQTQSMMTYKSSLNTNAQGSWPIGFQMNSTSPGAMSGNKSTTTNNPVFHRIGLAQQPQQQQQHSSSITSSVTTRHMQGGGQHQAANAASNGASNLEHRSNNGERTLSNNGGKQTTTTTTATTTTKATSSSSSPKGFSPSSSGGTPTHRISQGNGSGPTGQLQQQHVFVPHQGGGSATTKGHAHHNMVGGSQQQHKQPALHQRRLEQPQESASARNSALIRQQQEQQQQRDLSARAVADNRR